MMLSPLVLDCLFFQDREFKARFDEISGSSILSLRSILAHELKEWVELEQALGRIRHCSIYILALKNQAINHKHSKCTHTYYVLYCIYRSSRKRAFQFG